MAEGKDGSRKIEYRENPRQVKVEIGGNYYLAGEYRDDTVPGILLTRRPMASGYEIIEDPPRERIIVTFTNGDSPVHVFPLDPSEKDNYKRRYALTSSLIQEEARNGGGNAIQIPTHIVPQLEFSPGKKLVIPDGNGGALVSDSEIATVIVISVRCLLTEELIGNYPKVDVA